MFCKFMTAPSAGRHRDRARSERFATGNIARRVANDVYLRCNELAVMFLFRARSSEPTQLVAVSMIVGKRAKFKKMPDPVVFEFQLRSARDISSEKRKHHMRTGLESFEQLEHAWEEFALSPRQFQRKKMDVAVEERAHVFVSRGNFMLVQDVEHDPRIGHTCDLDAAQVIINSEPLFEGALQCFDARSS